MKIGARESGERSPGMTLTPENEGREKLQRELRARVGAAALGPEPLLWLGGKGQGRGLGVPLLAGRPDL